MSKYQKRQYRLPGFNYASNDAYFVTINTTDRVHFFGQIKEGKMLLSEMGEVVVNELEMANIHKKNILISDYVVMPDHVHIIAGLQNKDISKRPELIKKNPAISGEIHSLQKGSLPSFVNHFKGRVTREIREKIHADFGWQPKYHDRIIRDSIEYERIAKYIADNVAKWDGESRE
jgi:putative transposase